MKIAFLQIFLAVLCLSAQAQKVSNIRAEQRGQEIVVLYSLETTSPCEVRLLLSQDNGASWSPALKNVSGDVGNKVSSGDKQIIWEVLEEQEQLVGEKNIFKIIANYNYLYHPEMVFVEGGIFLMGNNSYYSEEEPAHSVTLSSFNIGKFEVTQAQWKAVMGSNPSINRGCDNCPVEYISWNEIQEYIQKLNSQTNRSYRLPTEAEWEYAAKGGKASKGFTYSGSNDLDSVAWYDKNSGLKTHVVGTKQANELGLFDMSGNVMEWCADWYSNYNSYSETNPKGPSLGESRVSRDGSAFGGYYDCARHCRVESRIPGLPIAKGASLGFRLVLSADPSDPDNLLNKQSSGNGEDEGNNVRIGGGSDLKSLGSGYFTVAEFGKGTSWSLKDRGNLLGPSTSKKPTVNGTVEISITVDKNGRVTSAFIIKSNITKDVTYNHGLAIEAAKSCTFTSSSKSAPQKGTITFVFEVPNK
jgi:TonB family protein